MELPLLYSLLFQPACSSWLLYSGFSYCTASLLQVLFIFSNLLRGAYQCLVCVLILSVMLSFSVVLSIDFILQGLITTLFPPYMISYFNIWPTLTFKRLLVSTLYSLLHLHRTEYTLFLVMFSSLELFFSRYLLKGLTSFEYHPVVSTSDPPTDVHFMYAYHRQNHTGKRKQMKTN